jgi:ornithine cyclodeaminase/alanine dehydrogenase
MGLGNTGRAAMKVLLALYPERPLKIKVLKYKDQHTEYVKYFKGEDGKAYPNAEFVFVDSYEEVVRNSDVIISAVTYTDEDFCPDECYKPGCLVVAVHLRGFLNCDLAFDKVFCDDEGHVNKFKYFDKWKYHAEIADVITGKAKGRESDDEKIIAYNVGLSMHDMNFADKIYDMAGDCGQEISLDPPTDKFWV